MLNLKKTNLLYQYPVISNTYIAIVINSDYFSWQSIR